MERVSTTSSRMFRYWNASVIAVGAFSVAMMAIHLCNLLVFHVTGELPPKLAGDLRSTGIPYVLRVSSVPSGSALEVGDIVDLRQSSAEQRYRYANSPYYVSGEPIVFHVARGAKQITLEGKALPHTVTFFHSTPFFVSFLLGNAAWLLILSFGIFLALRRRDDRFARLLAAFLITFKASDPINHYNWLSPSIALDVVLSVASAIPYVAALILIVVCMSTFGRPLTRFRRVLRIVAIVSAVVAGILVIVETLAPFGTSIDPQDTTSATFVLASLTIPCWLDFAVIVAAVWAATGEERARATWAGFAITMLIFVGLTYAGFNVLFPDNYVVLGIIGSVISLAGVLGLSYALFNRRLLDIGFAINRATIFAGLSLIVFGTFNLAEWALGGWLSKFSRTTDAELSAALALGLGLSLKPLHDAVERFVNRVLFRKRHLAERALTAFAREAMFYSDGATLVSSAEAILRNHARAKDATFLSARGPVIGTLPIDDAAVVALRASQARLDLHTVDSELQGEYAFPLVVRGTLAGLLAIGPTTSGEPYAPDELDAIDRVALAVGIALDGLARELPTAAARQLEFGAAIEAVTAPIVGSIDALAHQISTLSVAVDSLTAQTRKSDSAGILDVTSPQPTAPI